MRNLLPYINGLLPINDIEVVLKNDSNKKIMSLIILRRLQKAELLPKEISFDTFDEHLKIYYEKVDGHKQVVYELEDKALKVHLEQFHEYTYPATPNEKKEFSEEDFKNIHELVIKERGEQLARHWLDSNVDVHRNSQEITQKFKKNMQTIWGDVLKILDTMLGTATAKGEEFNKVVSKNSQNHQHFQKN